MLRGLLLFIFICGSAALQNQTIKVKLGDDVTLKCNFKGHSQVTALLWERTDNSEQYVLFYRDSKPDPEKQDPLYKNRVDLLDTAMTDGEVSITLKNVMPTDNGTYECFVAEKTNRPKRSVVPGPPVCHVTLVVVPHQTAPAEGHGDGQKNRGHVWVFSFILFVLVLCTIIGLILRNKNHCSQQETGRAESQVELFTTE
ncbi:CD276 antigen homolog isoform X2 [Gouania willdenowi]|uniref:CD276 antigen homolog isoform X2 n=1 Tax=Gouania willdenowi TaxID=441366 RepID=UPI00105550FE|nr:CD276 antigen homolog isoform X2 [Gouania willdenowi]